MRKPTAPIDGLTTAPRKRRHRGEGSIYQTAGGGWRGALLITDPTIGRPTRLFLSGPTSDAVRRKMTRLRSEADRGVTSAGPRLIVDLKAIPETQRIAEEAFYPALAAARPRLLGALLDAAVVAFDREDQVVSIALALAMANPDCKSTPHPLCRFLASAAGARGLTLEPGALD
jgi:hypothetical protein